MASVGATWGAILVAQGGPEPTATLVNTHTPTVTIAPNVLERHRVTSVNDDISADTFRMLRTQVLMARFYAEHVLPRVLAYGVAVRAGSSSIMALTADQF